MSENVADFQDELVTLFTAALAGEDDLIVRFGFPLKTVPPQNQRVYVIPSTNYRLGGGEQYREESFAARFVIEVYKSGDHAADTDRRMWEIINLIDAALYAEDFHGYAQTGMTLAVDPELVGFDTGYIARAQCQIGASEEV